MCSTSIFVNQIALSNIRLGKNSSQIQVTIRFITLEVDALFIDHLANVAKTVFYIAQLLFMNEFTMINCCSKPLLFQVSFISHFFH